MAIDHVRERENKSNGTLDSKDFASADKMKIEIEVSKQYSGDWSQRSRLSAQGA